MNQKYLNLKRLATLTLFLATSLLLSAQNNYDKGWDALNQSKLMDAVSYFEKAVDKKENKENALITLSQLYTRLNKPKKAEEAFQKYYKLADDPYAETYALWFTDAVIGFRGTKQSEGQNKFLQKLSKDPKRVGKIDAAMNYWLGTHHAFSFDKDNAQKYYQKINSIREWLCLGPFDNVMNSGFDKDFGVLANPNADATFKSKYGAPIKWFNPELASTDSYTFIGTNFTGYNSLVYYQTFVKSEELQDVIMKFGYTGSLKVWVNDVLVHSISDLRKTEMDYYRYKGKIQKGYNRILIQLGDYNTNTANFILRFTDLEHNDLNLPYTREAQAYAKGKFSPTEIPFFAVTDLKKKITEHPNDLVYPFLLAKTYMRSNEINKAEDVLTKLEKKYPTNYLFLRTLIKLYDQSGNTTEQNRYYEIYEKNNPEDMDILSNEISKKATKKDKTEFIELTKKFDKLYGTEYSRISHASSLNTLNEDYDAVIKNIESLYAKFPNKLDPVASMYRLEKDLYTNPAKANKVLEKYLKNNYSYKVMSQLVENYNEEGNQSKAIKLLQKSIDLFNYESDMHKELISIHYRQKEYDKAIKIAEEIIKRNPSDSKTHKDLGVLYNMKGKKKKAIASYERSLSYAPFSFEVNEKLRELKGKKTVMDIVQKIDPDEAIENYKKNFKTDKKEIFDIVVNNRSFVVFKSKAVGSLMEYIIKINDEETIQQYQTIDFSPGSNFNGYINEAQTIKANGNKISGEQNNGTVTFTQLEVGDYIYVSYMETQTYGGKSSLFVYDDFNFNSYSPTYEINYKIFTEEGLNPNFKAINHDLKPTKKTEEGFNIHTWQVFNPDPLKSESFSIPFSDIAQTLHVSLGDNWYDIAQWYSDLSGHQARPDFTIETITKELFEGKNYSKEEKAKVIYDFVIQNIQYSSLDFRQSSHIPQKASKTYHSRLGDCKDLSTLYCSIARAAGLKSNMVLINTRNNGQKIVSVPSLNFNHCIVRVELDNEQKFLELTDPELPFGHLYYYHEDAAILEIPFENIDKNISLTYLKKNNNHANTVARKSTVNVESTGEISVRKQVVKTGTDAASFVSTYYNTDKKEREDILHKSIAGGFGSLVKIKSLEFELLEPRNVETKYTYEYTVEDDILKVGSFNTLKIPFADKLLTLSLFESEERNYPFDFLYYESTDRYEETIEITIPAGQSFLEIPENVSIDYDGNKYRMNFEKLSDQKLKVIRTYSTNRKNIQKEKFSAFEDFAKKVIDAEKTHVVFK